MDERYTNSLIDSVKTYMYNLQYLAKESNKTRTDLAFFQILTRLYNDADWYEVSESNKIKIQKLMDCLIRGNSSLILPTITPGTFYSNVNTPQTIWTWQRIYDNLGVNTYAQDPEVTDIINTMETIGFMDDLGFEFRDIIRDQSQSYDLDLKVSYRYVVQSIILETDNGTLEGITITLNDIPIIGLETLSVTTNINEILATANRTTELNDRVTLYTNGSFTGEPTLLKGKLRIMRI